MNRSMKVFYLVFSVFVVSLMLVSILQMPAFRMWEENSKVIVNDKISELEESTRVNEIPKEDIEAAIEKGLEYLNNSQQPDGGWNSRNRYGKMACTAGYALRAFIDYNASDPRWEEPIDKSLQFLKWIWKDPETLTPGRDRDYNGGCLQNTRFAPTEPTYEAMYTHGGAAIGLIDYYFYTRDHSLLKYLNGSIEFTLRTQNTERKPSTLGGPINGGNYHGGWRYRPSDTSSDMSLTGWHVHTIILAKSLGIYPVPQAAFDAAVAYIKRSYHSGYKGFTYTPRSSTCGSDLTGIGVFSLYMMGAGDSAEAQGGVQFIKARDPQWGREPSPSGAGGNFPFYWYYYSTLAMYMVGGDDWKDFRYKISRMLLDNQKADGSWYSSGWGESSAGESWQTAIACLILETGLMRPNIVVVEAKKDPATGEADQMVKLVDPLQWATYNITITSKLGFVETPLHKPYDEPDQIELYFTPPRTNWKSVIETPTDGDEVDIDGDGDLDYWVELSWQPRPGR